MKDLEAPTAEGNAGPREKAMMHGPPAGGRDGGSRVPEVNGRARSDGPQEGFRLGLRAGDWVEVRSREEILGLLDQNGKLDGLPFMPEMLQYCGRRFRVSKRAEKACDTVHKTGARRMMDAAHLEDLRCDGAFHAGCQAACRLFWKEAWLRRAPGPTAVEEGRPVSAVESTDEPGELLLRASRGPESTTAPGAEVYRCQATEMFTATQPMRPDDIRQYARDLRCGNVTIWHVMGAAVIAHLNMLLKLLRRPVYLSVCGPIRGKTPGGALDLKPGEMVEVKSREEILATLNEHGRNRGLSFDAEMIRYCGRRFRVLRRVEKIIDERTGMMRTMPNDCLILSGVTCVGNVSPRRLFCQRAIYPYWREIWLRRVED
jgi:hypothetical protein